MPNRAKPRVCAVGNKSARLLPAEKNMNVTAYPLETCRTVLEGQHDNVITRTTHDR